MRHGKKFNHLGRKSAHRKAMLANMSCSLIQHKRINTTIAKAKALRKYLEPLLTKSKNDTTHSRRTVFSYLKNKYAITELFRDIAPKIATRPGGYTRILKTGNRYGDSAEMCYIELVDYNENMLKGVETKKTKARTRRSKKTTEPQDIQEATVVKEVKKEKKEDVNVEAKALKEVEKEEVKEIVPKSETKTEVKEFKTKSEIKEEVKDNSIEEVKNESEESKTDKKEKDSQGEE